MPAMAKSPRVAGQGEMWIMLMHKTNSYFSPLCSALQCVNISLQDGFLMQWSSLCQYRQDIVRSHLKQGSRRIGRVHLNKRKDVGETLAVEWNKLIVQLMRRRWGHLLDLTLSMLEELRSEGCQVTWKSQVLGLGFLLQD